MFYNGQGTKKDGFLAAYWIKKAVISGSEKAKEKYKNII